MTDPKDDKTRSHVILANGTMVSHYRIIEKIGAGGMGEVFLAEDTKLNRRVALKFLSSQSHATDEAKTRFVNEARAAASLDHPNICAVFEIDESHGRTFIAMAYIDGQSLREKIQAGPLKLREALNLGIDIARGLQEAHEKQIIHRDIKSANVMVNKKGQGKVTDFGLAKLVGGSCLTKTGTTMGTAGYMSPEQVRGETVDHRADIWAVGVVIYEMVTGRLPFKGDSNQAVTHQIVNEDHEPITAVRSGVPMELERIVNKCMAKDAADRYQHADDLAVDLRNVRDDKAATKSIKRPNRLSLPVILVLAVAVLYLLFKPELERPIEQPFENPLANATFRQLTDIEGSKDATISPDGKFVAFVSDQDGEFDIWVSSVETGNIYNRTKGQYGDMRRGLQDVGFTPNSSEILSFAISRNHPILIMPLLEGRARKFLRDSVIMVDWTPDGSRLVYFTDNAGDPVFVADADGTNYVEILGADSGMHQHYQRWSVDGQWIYMNRGSDNVWDTDLWRVRPDGSQLEQLTEDQLNVSHPVPISERIILFIARDKDGSGPWIWAVDVQTKAVKRVSVGLERYTSLSASDDGLRLATSVIKAEANLLDIWSVPIRDTVVFESDVTQYILPVERAQAPRFGGEALYFLSGRGTGDGLWRFSEGQLMEVWKGARSPLYDIPAVSPDGQSIAITLKRDGKQHLHLINSDGSDLRLLSDSIDVRGSYSFSPDGQWIVTGAYDKLGRGLFRISIEDGLCEKLMDGEALHPVWSPKGDLIIFTGKQVSGFSTLKAIRPNGEIIELPEIRIWVSEERFRFLPDGTGLVYLEGWFAAQDFHLLDLSTMTSRKLTNLNKSASLRTFDISPDGHSIVFDRMRVKTEIVLIELANDETRDVKP